MSKALRRMMLGVLSRYRAVPLLWLLLGCAPLKVSLELETPRPDRPGRRAVLPDETLNGGDKLAMNIRVDRPAHVYLLRSPPSGGPLVLYPDKDDKELAPGTVLRVPDKGSWFELNQDQGLENVVLVASAQALTPDAVRQALGHETPLLCCTAEQRKEDKGRDDKKGKDETRPCHPKANDECKRGGDGRLLTRADRRGIAVIRFPFEHR